METIDFRSDTVTWPTPAMREAMAKADLGDDVYGEDPTVNELERMAAAKVGMEAGLFVASGTMGNLAAVLTHANRGAEAILGIDSHVFSSEAGGMSALGGVVPRPLPTDEQGRMDYEAIEAAISPDDPHYPRTRLILVENTYGARNGMPIPASYFAEVSEIAKRNNLAVHLDGARLFNAAIALNGPATDITQFVDSVSFCLSKGLCAPVGSVLCGSAEFIHQARRSRKILGGGMRQAGILAAAGIVALEQMVDRLAEDHANASLLANGLAKIQGLKLDPGSVKSNIIFFRLDDDFPMTASELEKSLYQNHNILIGPGYGREFRVVTHYWVGRKQVELLLEALHDVLAAFKQTDREQETVWREL